MPQWGLFGGAYGADGKTNEAVAVAYVGATRRIDAEVPRAIQVKERARPVFAVVAVD